MRRRLCSGAAIECSITSLEVLSDVESYYDAIKTSSPSQIEAIDMGRRALHNEGATLMRERIAEHAEIDHLTARRFFTLLCVLHMRG